MRSLENQLGSKNGEAPPALDTGYVGAQHRRSLYRVLARNIVRQLLDSGHQGHELLPFVSEVMQAITDNGWDDKSEAPSARDNRSVGVRSSYEVCADELGRPTITCGDMVLRPPTPGDLAALQSWEEDPRVRASLVRSVLQFVMDNLGAARPAAHRIDLIICNPPTGEAVGLVSLHEMQDDVGHAELGKVVGNPEFRGRGLAAQATRLIVAYGFERIGLNRIYLRTLGANIKNIRLNERLGVRFEGVLREAAVLDGRPADVALMAMLRSEYLGQYGD